ncbi:MAG: hypothetical protein Q9221_002361 [Calogaya cf. arnoldii]
MAEALAAVGVSASILQIVSLTAKLIQRFNDFNSIAEEMPRALRSIHIQLPFLRETCQNLDTGDESENVSMIIKECHREIEDLYKTVDRLLPGPGDPRLSRAIKALKSMQYQQKFDHALRKIESFKIGLILHCCQKTTDTPIVVVRHLQKLDRRFNEYEHEDSMHKIIVLLGMGGQGKSRLALDFARRVSIESQSTLVLWLDATTKQTMTRAFEDIADLWNGRKRRFIDSGSRIRFVHEALAERKWLVVFDNYDHPDQFADVCLLGKAVQLSGMDEGEGLELLRLRTGQDLDEPSTRAAAIKVLQTLGYLPLAIDQAGAYNRQQTLPLPLFLQTYKSQKQIILNQKHIYWDYKKRLDSEEKAETPLDVLTTWELSIQQIGSAHISRGVVEHILTVAAFLGHVEISESLFRYAQYTRPAPSWLVCFTSDGEWDSHRYRDMVSSLLRLSLAQGSDSITGESCLSLHPIIKDWLQLRITETDRGVYTMETIDILANYINANIEQRSPRENRSLLGHLDACMDSHSKLGTGTHRFGFGPLRNHAITISTFYMKHGRYREAEEGFQAVLDHDTQLYGWQHNHTFRTVRQLADACVHRGKYLKAHDLLIKAYRLSDDKTNLETIRISSAFSGVLAKLDRHAQAEYCDEITLSFAPRENSAQLQVVYLLYERLAETKRYLGNHKESESLYLAAHQGYEAASSGLADLHRALGRYEEAEKSYKKAWQGYKKYLGSDHPHTTTMLTNLGISCRNQNKFEDAEIYLEESWKISQRSLGPEHPDSLRALTNLSICIDKQGHYREAEIKYRKVLKGREKKYGLNHAYTRRTIERLAHMLWMQGHYDQAETLVRKVLNQIGRPSLDVYYHFSPSNQSTFPALITLYTEARKRDQSKLAQDHVDALETSKWECWTLDANLPPQH